MRAVVCTVFLITLTTPAIYSKNEQIPVNLDPPDEIRLPISIERIKHQLDTLPVVTDPRDILRLNFVIRVYAMAPKINVFKHFDLYHGPVRSSTPTHTIMREMTTPQEFRSPAIFSTPNLLK